MNFIFHGEIINYDFFNTNSSDTILFLHGWGGNKFSFASSINLLKSKYNILTLTLPTTSPTKLVWNMFDYSDLILNLLKNLNIKNLIIVCHSFGFRIATILKNKLTIKKLIITGGAGPKKENFFKKIDKNNTILLSKRRNFNKNYKIFQNLDYASLSLTNKKSFQNIVNFNTIKMLKFSCPLLLFWGRKDKSTPIWIGKKLKKFNDAVLINSPFSHFSYLDDNDNFNHKILEFLK